MVRREKPDMVRVGRKPIDLQDMVADDLGLFQLVDDKMGTGHSYQLWFRKEGGILAVFSEDGTLIDKEYRKRKPLFWQNLLDLLR